MEVKRTREARGAWYTPDQLAQDFVSQSRVYESGRNLRTIDIACGDGALLNAVANEKWQRRLAGNPEWCWGGIVGIDIDLDAVEACAELAAGDSDAIFYHGDSLFEFEEFESRFDHVVMNPPFLGGKKISTLLGDDYRKRLKAEYGVSGNADLCASFLLAAEFYCRYGGVVSMIATNTIAQGDTRRSGLVPLLGRGWRIFDAQTNVKWPGDANVTVSLVHLLAPVCEEHEDVAWHLWHLQWDPDAVDERLRSDPEFRGEWIRDLAQRERELIAEHPTIIGLYPPSDVAQRWLS